MKTKDATKLIEECLTQQSNIPIPNCISEHYSKIALIDLVLWAYDKGRMDLMEEQEHENAM